MMRTTVLRSDIRTITMTLFLASLATACGGDDSAEPLKCVEVDPACVPGFPATWDNVYKFVVAQNCGVTGGVACHGADARQGMLGMFSQKDAFDGLVGGVGGHARVIPNDPSCSILMERLNATDPDVLMPYKGTQLSAADRCAVQQWIAKGAAE
jgi:hypothetical protein